MTEASGHIGLASMRERAELIDGKLSIESSRARNGREGPACRL